MISMRLQKFLGDEQAAYDVIPKSQVPDLPQEKAQAVIVKAAGTDVMVVLPSTAVFDPSKLGILFDAESVTLTSEEEIRRLFPNCEPGELPALGLPYGVPCFVDETLLDGEEIFFSAGNHEEVIRINSYEYWRIAQAEVGDFRKRGVLVH